MIQTSHVIILQHLSRKTQGLTNKISDIRSYQQVQATPTINVQLITSKYTIYYKMAAGLCSCDWMWSFSHPQLL